MSLPGSELLTLQAYADGELEGPELAAAEKLVAESAEARAFVESLAVLGYGVRAAHALEELPAIDVTSAVMESLDEVPSAAKTARPAASVTSLAAQRERRAQKSQVVVAIGALALAAAGILYLRGRGDEPHKAEVAQADTKPAASGVEVSNIESSNDKNVSVFYLPASGGNAASSVVVWIDEKGAP